MAAPPLTRELLEETAAVLRACGGNETRTAAELQLGRSTMQHRTRECLRQGVFTREELAEWRSVGSHNRKLPQSADECWALLDDFIGRSKRPTAPAKKPRASDTDRIVVASDFHAPFQANWAVAELIAREAGQTDTLVIGGDLQDSYSISRFMKYESVGIEAELAATDALLGQLAAAFPRVVVIEGNHDQSRFQKQLRSNLSVEMCHVIEFLTGGNLSTIAVMAKRYPNVEVTTHSVGRHEVGWFTQIGDVLVSHAETFSRVPGSALRLVEDWFSNQHDTLGLQSWRVILQAHTHQLTWFPYKSDRLLCEIGCLSETHGYQLQARVSGRPQRRGYCVLDQTNGVTDLNSVRLVWLDADRKTVM